MIPYILAIAGGYLIGQSRKQDSFADGGVMEAKYHITIMSEEYSGNEPDDDYYEDNHQKYGFNLMASDENDAIKKGKEKFMKEYSGYPIFWIKAFKIADMADGGVMEDDDDEYTKYNVVQTGVETIKRGLTYEEAKKMEKKLNEQYKNSCEQNDEIWKGNKYSIVASYEE